MNPLSAVLLFKIAATVLMWCVPMLLFPPVVLTVLGLPDQSSYLFIRLLGWAYLSLCVGYGFAYQAARRGEVMPGPIWMGLVSNGGASVLLTVHGVFGEWTQWGLLFQALAWASAVITGLIALGLWWYGIRREH
jgi:hypothetical protein